MKVAIVYDRVNKWGGAERLLLVLRKIFPNADLYTSILNRKKVPWSKEFRNIKTSFIQDFPLSNYHQLYAALMPLAFESFNFDQYDLVISVTSEAAKGVITKPHTRHICICLTPTRYLWSGYNQYFENSFLRFISRPVISYLRSWDLVAAQRPETVVAISKEVQKRIKRYYGRDSKVIYPPVDSAFSLLAPSVKFRKKLNAKPYFLVVSRLVPYKKVDIAIKACNKLKLPLKIVGTGSQEWYLKLISGPTIQFLGQVSEEKLLTLYEDCKALIFPGKEDFGLSMVEAQSIGKPVIAFRGGGALEIIKEGKTGEFFNNQNAGSLKNLLEKWDNRSYNSNLCIENSQRFSIINFKREFLKLLL